MQMILLTISRTCLEQVTKTISDQYSSKEFKVHSKKSPLLTVKYGTSVPQQTV